MRFILPLVLTLLTLVPPSAPLDGQQSDPPEQWYFWTDDGVMHYAFESGTARHPGDTIVVLHGGWGAEHSYLVRPLAGVARDYRLVFYDQRGSLRSPAPDSTILIDRLVADLEHLRASLGLEQMTLLAHSMGGALAYAYLAEHPNRVRGLVLVGATAPAPMTGEPPFELFAEVWPDVDVEALQARNQAFHASRAQRAAAVIEREGLIPEHVGHLPAESREVWEAMSDRDRTRSWRINFTSANTCEPSNWREMEGGMVYYTQNVANQITRPDGGYAEASQRFWPALRGYQGPVRGIIGTCDFVDLGPELWPRIVAHLHDGSLRVLNQTGHAPWLEDPSAFENAVRRALEDVRGAGGGLPGGSR